MGPETNGHLPEGLCSIPESRAPCALLPRMDAQPCLTLHLRKMAPVRLPSDLPASACPQGWG